MGLKVVLMFIVLFMAIIVVTSGTQDGTIPGFTLGATCQPIAVAGASNITPTPGLCPSNYQVQPGDSMSKIAARCAVPLEALVAANPQVINPNRIYVDNYLVIPTLAAAPQPAQPSAGTANAEPEWWSALKEDGKGQPTAAAPMATAQPRSEPVMRGIMPGQFIDIVFTALPPNTHFWLGIGKTGGQYIVVGEGDSDGSGRMPAHVMMSYGALNGEMWSVTAYIPGRPNAEYAFGPIEVGR